MPRENPIPATQQIVTTYTLPITAVERLQRGGRFVVRFTFTGGATVEVEQSGPYFS